MYTRTGLCAVGSHLAAHLDANKQAETLGKCTANRSRKVHQGLNSSPSSRAALCTYDQSIKRAIPTQCMKPSATVLANSLAHMSTDEAIELVRSDGRQLSELPKSARTKEVTIQAIIQNPEAFALADINLQKNQEVLEVRAYRIGLHNLNSSELETHPNIAKAAVTRDAWQLRFVDPTISNYRDLVETAVNQDGMTLKLATKALQNDREIVLQACLQEAGALRYTSQNLRDDTAIINCAVTRNGEALYYASERLQRSCDTVKKAVTQNGCALRFTPPEIRDNFDMVQIAVQNDGWALLYASNRLQNDARLLRTAYETLQHHCESHN